MKKTKALKEMEKWGLELSPEYYPPSESWEWKDQDGRFYNHSGQQLRDPEEYNHPEGYTPFGDE